MFQNISISNIGIIPYHVRELEKRELEKSNKKKRKVKAS